MLLYFKHKKSIKDKSNLRLTKMLCLIGSNMGDLLVDLFRGD